MKRFLMLCAIAAAAAAVGVSAAQAEVIQHENVPLDITLVACNGEDVHMTGTARTLITRTEADASGRVSIGGHIMVNLQGVGATSGGQYAFNSIINEMHEIDTTYESASVFTSVQPVTMSGAGTESNFRFFIIVVSTVSASGQSSSKFDFFSSCLEH